MLRLRNIIIKFMEVLVGRPSGVQMCRKEGKKKYYHFQNNGFKLRGRPLSPRGVRRNVYEFYASTFIKKESFQLSIIFVLIVMLDSLLKHSEKLF